MMEPNSGLQCHISTWSYSLIVASIYTAASKTPDTQPHSTSVA